MNVTWGQHSLESEKGHLNTSNLSDHLCSKSFFSTWRHAKAWLCCLYRGGEGRSAMQGSQQGGNASSTEEKLYFRFIHGKKQHRKLRENAVLHTPNLHAWPHASTSSSRSEAAVCRWAGWHSSSWCLPFKLTFSHKEKRCRSGPKDTRLSLVKFNRLNL